MLDLGSPEDTRLIESPSAISKQPLSQIDASDTALVWEYTQEGKMYGIPVAEDAKGLPLSTKEELEEALYLDRHPCLKVLSLSPDDPEGQRQYTELLDKVYRGSVAIIEEAGHFDPAKARFINIVKYNELEYRLRPRYYSILRDYKQ